MAELHYYLRPKALEAVAAGGKGIHAAVRLAVEAAGWKVTLHPDPQRASMLDRDGYHMVVNQPVGRDACLTLRPCGWEPFWQIEATNDRWDWQTARLKFRADTVDETRAAAFAANWRKVLFGEIDIETGGGLLVPLQGKLLQRRHFQSESPLGMLQAVLERWPGRTVTATLHPREVYTDDERLALAQLAATYPALRLSVGGTNAALARCDLVVTQNSTVALKGYLLEKPAMLWARIDFHHIAASVPELGLDRAFAKVESDEVPDYARYMFWYLRQNALFAWSDGLQVAIRMRLAALGWPIK